MSDLQIAQLHRCEFLTEGEVKALCTSARELLSAEPNVLHVHSPVTVCGDIHGQFFDLLELFRIGGNSPYTNYLFLGDFVDRGYFSVETFLLMLALKVRYPAHVMLLRGNHESREITRVYGFYDECMKKYGSAMVWRYCTEVFDCLPLAALIDGEVFCVHGGLSPGVQVIEDIQRIERRQEVEQGGVVSELLWSDPDEVTGWCISDRGPGVVFGPDIVAQFNHTNNVEMIARAHQLVMEGYRVVFEGRLVTVWSAPNYCYRCGNVAAILELDEHLTKTYKTFEAAEQDANGAIPTTIGPDYFL